MTSMEISERFTLSKISIHEKIIKVKELMKEFCFEIERIKENAILKNTIDIATMTNIGIAAENLDINIQSIERNKMKCAFFGKTSNGKSAVINAILNENILPSSIGRTTSCFITVEGCAEETGYLIVKNDEKRNYADIMDIANELNQEKYEVQSVVALFWPKSRCSILRNEIQFLDSPGVDYSNEHKIAIQSHCQDADVFVYVIDACSTINESEKEFFREVQSMVADPNIFILINKWDKCEDGLPAQKLARVKRQHQATVKSFFEHDLKMLCNSADRTFFVSAKEMLEETTSPESINRKEEFNRFVAMMSMEISHKAIINKFKPHLVKGTECLQLLLEAMDTIINTRKKSFSENYDESKLKSEIVGVQYSFFQVAKRELNELVDIESQEFVFFVMENVMDLTKMDGKINDVVKRIMGNLFKIITKATKSILEEIRAKLTSFSQINESINYLDNYLPSTEDQKQKPIIEGAACSINETVIEEDGSAQDGVTNMSESDMISTIAIIMPLNIELAVILSEKKKAKLRIKQENIKEKKFAIEKLCTKICDLFFKLFIRLMEQRQDDIRRLTEMLVDRFLNDHREYCRFIVVMERMRNNCACEVNAIISEMDTITQFQNI